jgi:hypothetical protein
VIGKYPTDEISVTRLHPTQKSLENWKRAIQFSQKYWSRENCKSGSVAWPFNSVKSTGQEE